MRYFNNPLVFHDSPGVFKRFMGLELEISDFDRACEPELETVLQRWSGSVVPDGSVNGTNPFEIRISPARGDKFIEQIRQICRVLRKGHAKANPSAGFHLHIDARDLAPDDLIKITTMWPHVEDAFFSYTLRKRKKSGYCEAWAKSLPAFRAENGLIRMYDDLKVAMARRGRFMSLNYEALRAHQTIENRMHHGTININKILNWAKMNHDFIECAKGATIATVQAKIAELPKMFPPMVKAPKAEEKKANQIIA